MKNLKAIIPALLVLGLAGCPVDDEPGESNTDTDNTTTPTTTSSTTTMGTDTSTTMATDSATGTTTTVGTTTMGGTDTESSTGTTGDAEDFIFREDAFTDYVRVDRMGFPAINTALITSKDDFNADDPADDLAGDWDDEYIAGVNFLHLGPTNAGAGEGLDDDITGAGGDPCTPEFGSGIGSDGECIDQNLLGAALVIPDDLNVDAAATAGFPNGRQLAEPVMDLTLAALLLDLGTNPLDPDDGGTHHIDFFAAVPMNPAANDVAFGGAFPYLAPAN